MARKGPDFTTPVRRVLIALMALVLIALFLFLTAPITGMFIAKAHLHLSWKRDELPPPGPTTPTEWATYGDTAAECAIVTGPYHAEKRSE